MKNHISVKNIMHQFIDVMQRYTAKGERFALAVSGGADSMCMLHLSMHFLKDYNKIYNNSMFVVSVEHGIRGDSSKKDLDFVAKYCSDNNIEFVPYSVDVPTKAAAQKISIETAARNARREIFNKIIKEKKADKVLLAHHANDNVESILMHLFRGSGLGGLVGMSASNNANSYTTNKDNDNNHFIRPLINFTREHIEQYNAHCNVPYITDESNSDSAYTRNFIRNEILPALKSKYPNVEKSILNLSLDAQKYLEKNNSKINKNYIWQVDKNIVKIDIKAFNAANGAEYIMLALEKIGAKFNTERVHINNVIKLAYSANGSSTNLPNNLLALKEYNHITIIEDAQKAKASRNDIIIAKSSQSLSDILKHKGINLGYKKELFFDGDKLPQDYVLRFRQNGDIFIPCNSKTKLFSDYLIDKKVPRRIRENIICLSKDNEIFIAVGLEISDKIKLDNSSKNIYSIKPKHKEAD